MDEAKLAEIEARCDAATPGKWERGGPYPGVCVCVCTYPGTPPPHNPEPPEYEPICVIDSKPTGEPNQQSINDGDFIAHARTDIPALIAALREARAEIESNKQALWEATSKLQ